MFTKAYFIFFSLLFSSLTQIVAQCPVSVTISSVPDLSLGPLCKGASLQLTANPSVGVIAPQYTWIVNGDTIFGAGQSTSLLANGQTVQLFMNTSTGCPSDIDSSSLQIQIVELDPVVSIINSICTPPSSDISIATTGGNPSYTYNLVGIGSSTTGNYNGVLAGSYELQITDGNGCRDTSQITIDPKVTLTPEISFTNNICNQSSADVLISTIGGSPSYTYNLQGIGQNSDGSFENVSIGIYILITTDSQGCMDTNTVTIVPVPCPDPVPQEAITPNGDGFNDVWLIANIDLYPENEVSIFDRWGQRVYHKNNYENIDGWDAKYLGVGLPVSTYYYVLQVAIGDDEKKTFKGAVSIFK